MSAARFVTRLVVPSLSLLAFVACGSSGTSGDPSSSPDPAGSTDASAPRDGAASGRDAGAGEAGEGAPDGATVDDAAVDGSSAADPVEAMLRHVREEVVAVCELTRGCCRAAGQTSFDMAKCTSLYGSHGMQGDLEGVDEAVLRGGKVSFSATKSAACHASVRALACLDIGAVQVSAAATACATTFEGTVSASIGFCRSSLECRTGSYCAPAQDPSSLPATVAGTAAYVGQCAPTKAIGASCASDDECSRRGDGNGCSPLTGKCEGPLPLGALCRRSGQCQSKLCIGVCAPSIPVLVTAGDCAAFL